MLLAIGLVGISPSLAPPLNAGVAFTLAGLVFAGVGWILTERLPGNGIGWCFLGVWCLIGGFNLADLAQHRAVQSGQYETVWGWAGGWLVGWMWGPLLLLATTLPLLLFPSGFAGPRSRVVGWIGVLAASVTVLVEMVSPQLAYFANSEQEVPFLRANNPLSPGFLAHAGPADDWPIRNGALFVLCITAVVAAGGLVVRGVRSRGEERLQFRWVVYGAAVVAVLISLTALPLFTDSSWLGTVTWAVALVALPVTMGVAILRFHLYDIDRVVTRTTSYAIVTGAVIATYAVLVTTISRLLPAQSRLAVTLATLGAAVVFQPLLRIVRAVVDRRFNRAHYNAQHTADSFANTLRTTVDATTMQTHLDAAITSALQPTRYAFWSKS
jgi:hypothetical protein